MTCVAVYGSLREGFHNHYLLEGSKHIAKGILRDFKMFSLGSFPAIIPSDSGEITVEVYEVSPNILARLDHLEGYPQFYNRMEVPVAHGDGEYTEAWVYFVTRTPTGLAEVPSGDWSKHYQR